MEQALKDIRREVKKRTLGLDTDDYIDFMRELAEWAGNEADMAEYSLEMPEDDNE